LNLVVAFLPAAVLGFLFHDTIKASLFTPRVVAWALIVGAIAIFGVEMLKLRARTTAVESMTLPQSLGIGVAQCAALVPGASRAAATILGGLVVGLDRPTAAQFSFLLAIPTLLGATALDLLKNYHGLSGGDWARIGVGFVVSFVAAWLAVRWFLHYVSHHSLSVFAVYRIVLGVVVLLVLAR
jgi:undecaprenyl-diphosphatase